MTDANNIQDKHKDLLGDRHEDLQEDRYDERHEDLHEDRYDERHEDQLEHRHEAMLQNSQRVKIPQGVRVLTFLHNHNISAKTPCGGHGSCGACLIRSVDGKLRVMNGDRIHLSEEQLKEGWRLLCQAFSYEACEIEIPEKLSKV